MRKHVFILCVFLSALNAEGQSLKYAKHFGAHASNIATMDIDAQGNMYITGSFNGYVMPGSGANSIQALDDYDIYFIKINPSGDLSWAKHIRGYLSEYSRAITVDASANIYIAGSFQGSTDFNPTSGNSWLGPLTGKPSFIAKYNSSGSYVWVKAFGGTLNENTTLETDLSGNVYVTGSFGSTADFDPGPDTFNLTPPTSADAAFILKLSSSGNFIWAKQINGTTDREIKSMCLDNAGYIYITGGFNDTMDIDPSLAINNFVSATNYSDIFIAKLDPSGNLIWAKQAGGADFEYATSIAVDEAGNVITMGKFDGITDFDPGPGVHNLPPPLPPSPSSSNLDVFISKLDASGNFVWALKFGSASFEEASCLAVDTFGNIFAAGFFESTIDFDAGPDTFNLINIYQGSDGFIARYKPSGDFVWAWEFNGMESAPNSFIIAPNGDMYLSGDFDGGIDFDPSAQTFVASSIPNYNNGGVYAAKLDNINTVSGIIQTETGIPVPGVTVELSGGEQDVMITGADGRYTFDVAPGANYTITPSKFNESPPANGVTLIDVLLMHRHILGMPLSSPYKIIAASEISADGDTMVNMLDILQARSFILSNIASFPTNRLWQFVSSDYVFPDANNPFPFDKTRAYPTLYLNQTNQNFIGIKLGDVNGSWDGNTL